MFKIAVIIIISGHAATVPILSKQTYLTLRDCNIAMLKQLVPLNPKKGVSFKSTCQQVKSVNFH